MKKEIQDLIEVSQYFGADKNYTLAGGGNTSYKDDDYIWVKASGSSLATIDEEGFAQLFRQKVKQIASKKYSDDVQKREVEVKEDLIAANVNPENIKRPSVETSFHELIEYPFVVHMHPTLTNSLMCSQKAREKTLELFGEKVLYISYAPGYDLFKKVESEIMPYREKYGKDPNIIFLENHGVFVSAENTSKIRDIYSHITQTIVEAVGGTKEFSSLQIPGNIVEFMPALRMILSEGNKKILRIRHSELHKHFYPDRESFHKASLPFTPDIIVYCKGKYMYIENSDSPEEIIEAARKQLPEFLKINGYPPKIIMIRNYGVIAAEDSAAATETALDVYDDLLKISYYSESFGGPHFLEEEDIAFIDNWEVENYRRKISKGDESKSLVDQKIAIVTGGAQGFGEGIATDLVERNANVIIADINEEKGFETLVKLTPKIGKNELLIQQTDVADPESLKQLIKRTVENFGGLDLYISNAGILRAGSIEEMDPEVFSLMTKINYEAYFLGVKYAAPVLKLQYKYDPGYFADIIQINSKSGLKGSNKNFAYAGGKFGGIGLTQSFAMELAEFNIKVNSICPGNFFEGPLWADPDKGLFVQYLTTGKVPGAKTIEDVKRFYEKKVPMGRGCRVEDVMKAIYYIIDQKYETGQAVPVTGGQEMLG
jgi:rhamnose utilization protein RhaD (predicted bifunctional aldolase and dehydrogenase)/NAD(P)-dependent dehydrogenase (short-subunit alcohol dehydrogenase family)